MYHHNIFNLKKCKGEPFHFEIFFQLATRKNVVLPQHVFCLFWPCESGPLWRQKSWVSWKFPVPSCLECSITPGRSKKWCSSVRFFRLRTSSLVLETQRTVPNKAPAQHQDTNCIGGKVAYGAMDNGWSYCTVQR